MYLKEENCIWSVIPDCLISPQNFNHNLKYFLQCNTAVYHFKKWSRYDHLLLFFEKMQWQAGRNLGIKNQLIHKSDESNVVICNAFVYICFFLKIWNMSKFSMSFTQKNWREHNTSARSKSLRQRSAFKLTTENNIHI